MKKMYVVLAFLMMGFVGGASASTLTWDTTQAGSFISHNNAPVISVQFGFGASLVGDLFNHSYAFSSTDALQVLVRMNELPHENVLVTGITYDNIAMDYDIANQRWFGFGVAGLSHIINIIGSVDREGSLYQITADSNADVPPPIPVPAAVWLFGSAIAGLMGVTRRKNKVSGLAA